LSDLREAREHAVSGGPARHREKAREQGKLPVRERLAQLLDADSFAEESLLASWEQDGLGADGVVTGIGSIGGRVVALMANDPTVKAGSWGPRTVEKILRIQERALELAIPMLYLVDSAGARITEQVQMFPGRRGAGRIFHTQVRLSGVVPQVCLLFGPSAAGGAYIPAFCDVVIMREGNASMYLGSPRMAEMVIGERVTLEEMGGARMHTGISGCAHRLAESDLEAIELARRYLSYFPPNWRERAPVLVPRAPRAAGAPALGALIPADENKPFDMSELIEALIDEGTWLEVQDRWARELIVGYARLEGQVLGIVASQPKHKGGVLFSDSADKAARFIWTCNAFNLPLLFLADVPGFMIGTQVEREGIIRHGAKMISAVSEATVPKISVIVRKAYGAGLYAMAGPAFDPDCCLALPGAQIAVMGPEAAINAVYYNQLQALEDEGARAEKTAELRRAYAEDIDILHLASELVVDAVVEPEDLRSELVRRFAHARSKQRERGTAWPEKRNPVTPV
jgi:acetyl-CoA carboxylase carboxyltransferase component